MRVTFQTEGLGSRIETESFVFQEIQVPKELFDIFDGHPFDGDHCFLCGIALDTSNRTVEHVFPRWLQHSSRLRDQTISLLNRTQIPYRNLVIPCCNQCNGTHLSALENRVRAVISDRSRSLDEISDKDLNAWISKIYIGIHWKELELKFDRKEPNSASILSREAMENFRMVHFFMQACRKEMDFKGPNGRFPNSLLRVRCKVPEDVEGQFDYLDNFGAHAVAIRIGDKGVVGIFDGGLHAETFPDFAEMQFGNNALHPVQFQETFAKLAYKSSLCIRVPYFGIFHEEPTDRYLVSLMAFDDLNKGASCVTFVSQDGQRLLLVPVLPKETQGGNAYSKWSQEEYARGLSWYTGIPFDQVFTPPDLVLSFLRDDKGNFIDIPVDTPS